MAQQAGLAFERGRLADRLLDPRPSPPQTLVAPASHGEVLDELFDHVSGDFQGEASVAPRRLLDRLDEPGDMNIDIDSGITSFSR